MSMKINRQIKKDVERVFHRYRLYKDCFFKNEDQKKFIELVLEQVESLPEQEKEAIKLRYMSSQYVFDYQVYELQLNISKDTYKKRINRAFDVMYKSFENAGFLKMEDDK